MHDTLMHVCMYVCMYILGENQQSSSRAMLSGHARPSSSLDGESSYKKARYDPERRPVKIPEMQVDQIDIQKS